jgi:hypothetical protein
VIIGVESGSQETMDRIKKDIKLEQVFESAEKCLRHGVNVIFPFIVGFPGEDDDSVQASLDVAKRLRALSPGFETPIFYFKPYPGSALTDDAVRDGYVLPAEQEPGSFERPRHSLSGSQGRHAYNLRRGRVSGRPRYTSPTRASGSRTWPQAGSEAVKERLSCLYPAAKGRAGGKLPAGKGALRSPRRSLSEASRKALTKAA